MRSIHVTGRGDSQRADVNRNTEIQGYNNPTKQSKSPSITSSLLDNRHVKPARPPAPQGGTTRSPLARPSGGSPRSPGNEKRSV